MQIIINKLKPTIRVSMSFSTRSPVLASHGCVACNQPLAAEAGVRILRSGGNAADAAVAVAACMNVTQPCSTGVGGDCFCLFYDAANKKVHGVNGRYYMLLVRILAVPFVVGGLHPCKVFRC